MRKPRNLTIDTGPPKSEINPYSVTKSGTLQFRDADIEISKKGLLVKGASPQASPKSSLRETPLVDDENPVPSHASLSRLELKDLKKISTLGRGSSGVVQKMLHVPTGTMLAVKIIQLDIKETAICKQIILELKTLHRTQCDYVVSFYDAFYEEGAIYVALELMNGGCLADILQKVGTIPEPVIAKITTQVLKGLEYLHKKLYLIHRDIKPSNLLFNEAGEVKISDFGVSGQLAHTLSKCASWVGTVNYMSPDRISGGSYSYDSDVWSLGLTLLELAQGQFPYPNSANPNMGFWELMEIIVKEPPPSLPEGKFSKELCSFVELCLQKNPEDRPSVTSLLRHPWIQKAEEQNLNLAEWFHQVAK